MAHSRSQDREFLFRRRGNLATPFITAVSAILGAFFVDYPKK
jgi:hypothetical protein